MSDLFNQLQPPKAGPQWAGSGPPVAIQAKFGAEEFALVVPVQVPESSDAPRLLGVFGFIDLQAIPPGTGWRPLTAPSEVQEATHLLVMGWMKVRPVRGADRVTYTATLGHPKIFALELQSAIDHFHTQLPSSLAGCLLKLPAPAQLPAIATSPARQQRTQIEPLVETLPTRRALTDMAPQAIAEDDALLRKATAFVFASCQYPAGVLDRPPAGASFNRLEQALATTSSQPPLAALLLLGDQIYADATYGILDPSRKDDRYHRAYVGYDLAMRKRVNVRNLANEGHLYVTPDDHEFSDNWEPGPDPNGLATLNDGLAAFDDERPGQQPLRQASGGYWGAVEVGGGHEVFMLDARTTREPRPWGPGTARTHPHILNTAQRTALENWLLLRQQAEPAGGPVVPKFLSSSVWLLPRLAGRADAPDGAAALSDSWDGYPDSLYWLLGFIAMRDIRGVVMLCGDAHLAGHTTVDVQVDLRSNTLHILHAPAMYAPFPFANGHPHEYRCVDRFNWTDASSHFFCQVNSALWPVGDGYVRVSVAPENGEWRVEAHFETGADLERTETWRVR